MSKEIVLVQEEYAKAGVDISAGNSFTSMIKTLVESAWPNTGQEIGGFAGGGPIPPCATMVKGSTDGTGTVAILSAIIDRFNFIGQNAVGMSVVDLYVSGSRPLYVLDTLSVAKLRPRKHIGIIKDIIHACKISGCRLIGGETAELPDMFPFSWMFNLDTAVIGFPEAKLAFVPIRLGQKVYGWLSFGPGSNGYSLLRRAHDLRLEQTFSDFAKQMFGLGSNVSRVMKNLTKPRLELDGACLADIMLVPVPIYINNMDKERDRGVKFAGHAHITGGGLVENIPRILPHNMKVVIDRSLWERPRIFSYTQDVGKIGDAEMDRVFNNGIMVVSIVDQNGPLPDDSAVIEIGTVESRVENEPQVQLVNQYRD